MALEHGGNLKTLGEGEQLIDCTQILKKAVAFLTGFQTQNGIKQRIYRFVFNFLIHIFLRAAIFFRFATGPVPLRLTRYILAY